MDKEHMFALFLLAGFDLSGRSIFQVKNEYGPEEYYGPWWVVQTRFGFIKIGWRKRVINIEWSDTPYRAGESKFWDDRPIDTENSTFKFTTDDVTQGPSNVHAWGYAKAVEYLQRLHLRLRQTISNKPEYQHMWDEEGKKSYERLLKTQI